jgi:hypothetical protein
MWEKSKRSKKRRVWEFQGDREEERGSCFLGRSSGKISLACGNLCEGHPSYPLYAIGMAKDLEQVLWEQKVKRKIFMRAVSKRNFSSGKYGKFIWPQAKRGWSFTKATKKKERCCVDPSCHWDTFGPHWKCSFKLWMAPQCGASS